MSRGRDRGRRRTRSRSRSRSRSRGRNNSPGRRGVSDVTSDPKTVNARIFVGSINVSMTREMLEEYFSKYGKVVGVSITRNKFGFVQFADEDEATACLSTGSTAYIKGHRVDVKPAKFGGGMGMGPPPGARRRLGNSREKSPLQGRGEEDYYTEYYGRGTRSGSRERDRDSRGQADYEDMFDDYYRGYYQRYEDTYQQHPEAPEVDGRPPPAPVPAYPSYSEPIDPLDPNRPNDVEIVVPNKMQRDYAENIEAQLKSLNMIVDLLFPPPDIPPSQVLTDLSQRRCLYAIFVTGDNENHRSLTLNILHSTPQEHRNMPVDDALRLIEQNFGEYVKKARQRNIREVVPRDIRNLLHDLLEMRPLSMGDLDKLIKYLKERQSVLVDDQIEQKRETAAVMEVQPQGHMRPPRTRANRPEVITRRTRIVEYHEARKRIREVSRLLGISRDTVRLWVRRHQEEDHVLTRP
ncbi:Nuclear receptor coactivator 5-like 1 [Homarus americanus]|uniref:Nuclear receptor coactivator 5-like 1 n=1 Tax=Homarus americanus TaxID=6706 RepID=A0A8J5N3A7_HOMAM|nr:Nuclear receptor coactivator 5-like 1 [Homarus americanus]